jgi:hypothetical protein
VEKRAGRRVGTWKLTPWAGSDQAWGKTAMASRRPDL